MIMVSIVILNKVTPPWNSFKQADFAIEAVDKEYWGEDSITDFCFLAISFFKYGLCGQ